MISPDTVNKMAELARLDLTDAERERYRHELSAILDYFDELSSLNTVNVPPTAQVTGLTNQAVADRPRPADPAEREAILTSAPARQGDAVQVKGVL